MLFPPFQNISYFFQSPKVISRGIYEVCGYCARLDNILSLLYSMMQRPFNVTVMGKMPKYLMTISLLINVNLSFHEVLNRKALMTSRHIHLSTSNYCTV